MRTKAREFSREFKVTAVLRMKDGETTARLAEDLQLRRKPLYESKQRMEEGGTERLSRGSGRPRKSGALRQRRVSSPR